MQDVIRITDLKGDLIRHYEKGTDMGDTTHYPALDKHFRWLKTNVLTMVGIGAAGKSTFLMQLLINKIWFDGWKVALFSPESFPAHWFYSDIVHTMSGKSTQVKYKNHISLPSYESYIKYIQNRIFLVHPESDSPTPEYINSKFEEIMTKVPLDAVVIDPFSCMVNALEKAYNREDRYVEWYITNCKRFAQKHNLVYITVTHPSGSVTRTKDGNFEPIDMFNIKGGSAWSNLGEDILTFHRPFSVTDPANTTCILKSVKIKKQKICGVPGSVAYRFDRSSNRFYEMGDMDEVLDLTTIDNHGGYCPLEQKEVSQPTLV